MVGRKGLSNIVAVILLIVIATILSLLIYVYLYGIVTKALSWVDQQVTNLIVNGSKIVNSTLSST